MIVCTSFWRHAFTLFFILTSMSTGSLTSLNHFFSMHHENLISQCHAATMGGKNASMEQKKAPGLLLCDPEGDILFSQNAHTLYIPASTLKVLTSLAAFHYLGEDFHFQTHFYLEKTNCDADNTHGRSSITKKPERSEKRKGRDALIAEGSQRPHSGGAVNPILRIEGLGDPLLTSEVLATLCLELGKKLRAKGVVTISGIVLDHSFFSPEISIDGAGSSNNPYDARVGALSANFNSVFFKYNPIKKEYETAEAQTPLLPFALKRVKASKMPTGRVILNKDEAEKYAGILIQHFLKKEGILVNGGEKAISVTWDKSTIAKTHELNMTKSQRLQPQSNSENNGKANPYRELIYTHVSPFSLKEVVGKLLKYSNNFIANQLFLTIGAMNISPPATVEKGIQSIEAYASNPLGITVGQINTLDKSGATKNHESASLDQNERLQKNGIRIFEGSGLSRKNHLTPWDLGAILKRFKPYHGLMSWKRIHVNNSPEGDYGEFYKTGTLHGVRTRCGYFKTPQGLYPFVIMVNQKGKGYDALKKMLWRRVIAHEGQ